MVDIENFFDYQSNPKTKSAVQRQLGIIGEAASKYKKANIKFELTHIQQIISYRNRLIHAYDSIDDSNCIGYYEESSTCLEIRNRKTVEKVNNY